MPENLTQKLFAEKVHNDFQFLFEQNNIEIIDEDKIETHAISFLTTGEQQMICIAAKRATQRSMCIGKKPIDIIKRSFSMAAAMITGFPLDFIKQTVRDFNDSDLEFLKDMHPVTAPRCTTQKFQEAMNSLETVFGGYKEAYPQIFQEIKENKKFRNQRLLSLNNAQQAKAS